LKGAGVAAAATVLAACKPQVVEKVVRETVQVEKEVEKQVTVAPTEAPRQAAEVILMYQTNEISDELISLFNEKYAPYHVTRIDVDFTKLFAMLAAGEAVDMVRVYGTFIPRYVIQRVCKDLTDHFNISTVLKPDDLLPVNDLYVVNGRRYGMVKDWSPDVSIWANKKLWAEAGVEVPDPKKPLSLQEWRALSPRLTKKEG
ncbi:MAG: extracellular solute-binding protein, partial [Anaerolineae bacterium]|nr:extracellular solute-binding protein [Anaerolineae bacterium]